VEFRAGQPTSVWPQSNWGANPVPQQTADGTAAYVADPTGGNDSITYVAAGYAKVRNFPMASVQNAAGTFTQPDEENVTVALGYATPRGNGTFQLAFNGPDRRAYFPSTYSYILAQTAKFDPGKGATLARFLCYAVSKGQVIAPTLKYARLSAPLVDIAINAIVQIPGAPSKANCPVAGAPPPPPPPSVAGGPGATGSPGSATGSNGSNGGTSGNNANSSNGSTGGPAGNSPAARAARAKLAAKLARERAAAAAAAGIGAVTTTTDITAELQRAASLRTTPQSKGVSTIWLLLVGVVLAWGVSFFVRRRSAT
jgi:phosphate transport system substrate-binding protein